MLGRCIRGRVKPETSVAPALEPRASQRDREGRLPAAGYLLLLQTALPSLVAFVPCS